MGVNGEGCTDVIRYSPGGGEMRFRSTCATTGSAFFLLENCEAPGGGTPLHCHTREDEFFYVIEGELTLWVAGKVVKLGAGETIFAPRDVPHCFKNCSTKPVRFLVFCTPGAIEKFFDYGLAEEAGVRPSDERLIGRIMAMAPEYGIKILGPSPL